MKRRKRGLRRELIVRNTRREEDGESPKQRCQPAEHTRTEGGERIVAVRDSARPESGKTLWPQGDLEELRDALLTQKQIILAGPPGTGKTWVAKHLAFYLRAGRTNGVRVVQFHPSYGYEDFIEGLRPVAERNQIEFKIVKGVVLEAVEEVTEGEPYILVLDELNRANLPRVFGELMYALEYRGPDNRLQLQYERDFFLPNDLLFIGTMNTADRSIRSIDIALRRRFEIFECFPDPDILGRFYETPGRDNDVPDLIDGFQALNQRLTADIDRHHTIGQTFFMSEKMTGQRLQRVWQRQLQPLIEEYFFDQPDVGMMYRLEEFWPSQA
jgi:5-methylcytosine-specific restriction protein B